MSPSRWRTVCPRNRAELSATIASHGKTGRLYVPQMYVVIVTCHPILNRITRVTCTGCYKLPLSEPETDCNSVFFSIQLFITRVMPSIDP